MNKSRLFFDWNHLTIRCLFADREMINNPKPDFSMHRHMVLTSLFYNINKFRPDEVLICIDARKNWRKTVSAGYKIRRQIKRDADLFPWEDYYEYMDDFISSIRENFPFVILQVRYAEADDVIGVLSKHLSKSKENILVTSDKDYIQLLMNKNVKLFDPMKRKFVTEKDPQKQLELKYILGDDGDDVLPIHRKWNVKRVEKVNVIKKKIGPKTALKLLEHPEDLEELLESNPEVKANYEMNKKLVDLAMIPNIIAKEIIEAYEDYEIVAKNSSLDLMKFFIKYSLRRMNEDRTKIMMLVQPLYGNVVEKENEMEEFF